MLTAANVQQMRAMGYSEEHINRRLAEQMASERRSERRHARWLARQDQLAHRQKLFASAA